MNGLKMEGNTARNKSELESIQMLATVNFERESTRNYKPRTRNYHFQNVEEVQPNLRTLKIKLIRSINMHQKKKGKGTDIIFC